jgi:hypothetical protein
MIVGKSVDFALMRTYLIIFHRIYAPAVLRNVTRLKLPSSDESGFIPIGAMRKEMIAIQIVYNHQEYCADSTGIECCSRLKLSSLADRTLRHAKSDQPT